MKIFLDSIGCRLNQSEIEKMGNQFRLAGHEIVESPSEADLVVVNTCTVTRKAASDSRKKIRHAARVGKAEVIVTGCWSTMEPEAAEGLPSVVKIVSNQEKENLVADFLNIPAERFDLEPIVREALPGIHMRTRAFIKAQDGCDNHCTFCVTRLARGASKSRSADLVLKDIHGAELGGVKEVVLTGVHLASWGQDFSPEDNLKDLIQMILMRSEIQRLRLSSVEPWDLDEAFLRIFENPRVCRHLHIPLQSGCDRTLRRMGRKTFTRAYADLLESARKVCPDIAITTDMIVGFPGETENDFKDSLTFTHEMGFADGHVFAYSSRPHTPAARLPNQIPEAVRKERSARLREVFKQSSAVYRRRFLDDAVTVLWESGLPLHKDNLIEGWLLQGLTDHYLRVTAKADQFLWNEFSQVRVKTLTAKGVGGEIFP